MEFHVQEIPSWYCNVVGVKDVTMLIKGEAFIFVLVDTHL